MWASDGALSYAGVFCVAILVGIMLFGLLSAGANAAYYRQTEQEWRPDDAARANVGVWFVIVVFLFLVFLGFTQPGAVAGLFGGH